MTPQRTSTAIGRRKSVRSGTVSSRGRDQPAASAGKARTSTAAAAAAKSSSGMGRSALPTMPCAKTSMGAGESRNGDDPADGGAVEEYRWAARRLRPGAVGRAVGRHEGRLRRSRVAHVRDVDLERQLAVRRAAVEPEQAVRPDLLVQRDVEVLEPVVGAEVPLRLLRQDHVELLAVAAGGALQRALRHDLELEALQREVEVELVRAGHDGVQVEDAVLAGRRWVVDVDA